MKYINFIAAILLFALIFPVYVLHVATGYVLEKLEVL